MMIRITIKARRVILAPLPLPELVNQKANRPVITEHSVATSSHSDVQSLSQLALAPPPTLMARVYLLASVPGQTPLTPSSPGLRVGQSNVDAFPPHGTHGQGLLHIFAQALLCTAKVLASKHAACSHPSHHYDTSTLFKAPTRAWVKARTCFISIKLDARHSPVLKIWPIFTSRRRFRAFCIYGGGPTSKRNRTSRNPGGSISSRYPAPRTGNFACLQLPFALLGNSKLPALSVFPRLELYHVAMQMPW
ncbi:uncharacterized protein BDR25DRAFT_350404 [Lindgomyces ingoldianus]|uniref:Uncharacterized protein n=1 Tax=Lindgomyces ingoldianus TaxID=673940 RepID=A0ACB6RAI4_9PLEO|nr:uncharacterized protein BDR25DRAFT_350404 [Lindgomyces ingoldianus]KAF2476102.1 hypothetical protein BDR25DRAFT_350404 [Lindgomyces ingoldianus]